MKFFGVADLKPKDERTSWNWRGFLLGELFGVSSLACMVVLSEMNSSIRICGNRLKTICAQCVPQSSSVESNSRQLFWTFFTSSCSMAHLCRLEAL
jgi:hypothetical protein